MHTKWRSHERLLATLLTGISIAGYIWHLNTPSTEQLAVAFREHHMPFDLYRNVLLPQICVVLSLYLSYLWVNYAIGTLRHKRLAAPQTRIGAYIAFTWFVLQLAVVPFFLAVSANVATYYAHPHFVSYGPSFRLLSLFGYNERPLSDTFAGINAALLLLVLFGVYAGLREGAIYWIEQTSPRRAYRIVLTNQVTTLATVYIALGRLLAAFDVVGEELLLGYCLIIPPVLLLYLGTTYWLFPTTNPGQVKITLFLSRLLALSLLCTFPFALLLTKVIYHEGFLWVLLGCWAGQMLGTVPVSWWLYQQRQDAILQLRGVEQRLERSAGELHRLRSQINPHFLFNTLNTLYGTALKEYASNTAEGVQRLGDMMRFMLEEDTQDFIPLDREISYLENYIALQLLRTPPSPTLCIEATIPPLSCPQQIAPMLLLPFIENAFKHGISLKEPSWVRIQLHCDAEHIRFEVRNSLHSRPKPDRDMPGLGIGLQNVTERLRLLYGRSYQLNCGEEGVEYVVQLVLPPST